MQDSITKDGDKPVVEHQDAIYVFVNAGLTITIKAFTESGGEELIAFHPIHAQTIINAIERAVIDIEGLEDEE